MQESLLGNQRLSARGAIETIGENRMNTNSSPEYIQRQYSTRSKRFNYDRSSIESFRPNPVSLWYFEQKGVDRRMR